MRISNDFITNPHHLTPFIFKLQPISSKKYKNTFYDITETVVIAKKKFFFFFTDSDGLSSRSNYGSLTATRMETYALLF